MRAPTQLSACWAPSHTVFLSFTKAPSLNASLTVCILPAGGKYSHQPWNGEAQGQQQPHAHMHLHSNILHSSCLQDKTCRAIMLLAGIQQKQLKH
jgi:hypothetical protein